MSLYMHIHDVLFCTASFCLDKVVNSVSCVKCQNGLGFCIICAKSYYVFIMIIKLGYPSFVLFSPLSKVDVLLLK